MAPPGITDLPAGKTRIDNAPGAPRPLSRAADTPLQKRMSAKCHDLTHAVQ
jgi:hypothetical protein